MRAHSSPLPAAALAASLFACTGLAFAQNGSLQDLPDAPTPAVTAYAMAPSPFQQQSTTPQQPQPSPSVDDLGFGSAQTKADPDLQKRLDRRSHMLKVHQRWGVFTLAPLAAACISSAAAPPDPKNGGGNTVGRDIHLSLGSLAALSYGATAYYAIRAPKVEESKVKGGIKLHKYLAFVHGPGMILTPVLGAMAFNQANNGERVHGIAKAHGAVAWTTVLSYGAAIVAVSWPIHLKRS